MPPLSDSARFILDRMEPGCRYEPQDLRAFDPDVSIERLREIMHELWVSRQVERLGYSGWRRHRSAPQNRPRGVTRETTTVKPEELFDHAAFTDFFK
jgi:hypothetical protein